MTDIVTQTMNVLYFSGVAGAGFTGGVYFVCWFYDWRPIQTVVINKFNCDEGIRVSALNENDEVARAARAALEKK